MCNPINSYGPKSSEMTRTGEEFRTHRSNGVEQEFISDTPVTGKGIRFPGDSKARYCHKRESSSVSGLHEMRVKEGIPYVMHKLRL